MSDERVKRLGGFRIVERLKESGSQAEIYRAVCEQPPFKTVKVGEMVALKVMLVQDEDGRAYERLQHRTAELVLLDHPNVVRYRGCFRVTGEFNDAHVVVLDYLEGQTLKERLLEQPNGMDVDDALRLVDAALAGLEYTSACGIVHRDVKPGNIFICEDGQVKMIDFEIATRDGGTVTVDTNNLMGTFDYMAPDFTDSSFRGDTCSDVFSMGVVMHEAITGKTPYERFEGADRQAGFAFHARWSVASGEAGGIHVSRRVKRILSHADEVLQQALACDREQRFQDFTSFRLALQGIRHREIRNGAKAYRILQLIGKGGFGEVFKARERHSGEVVAVKHLLKASTAERFAREARLMRKMHDPSFVEFKEIFQLDNGDGTVTAFLVMAYLEGMPGSSLRDVMKRAGGRGLPTVEVLKAFSRYAHGLSLLHGEGIVHRDIKPSNLYFPEWDIAASAIMDLGIARDGRGTKTIGGVPGTPDYMPPEIALTSSRGDAGMDVWALGLCLYEALTGKMAYPRLPSGERAFSAFLRRVKERTPPNFDAHLLAGIPELMQLLRDMTELDPSRRLHDAAQLEQRLLSIASRLEKEDEIPTTAPSARIGSALEVGKSVGSSSEKSVRLPSEHTLTGAVQTVETVRRAQMARPPAPQIPVKVPSAGTQSRHVAGLTYAIIGILVCMLGLGGVVIWKQDRAARDRRLDFERRIAEEIARKQEETLKSEEAAKTADLKLTNVESEKKRIEQELFRAQVAASNNLSEISILVEKNKVLTEERKKQQRVKEETAKTLAEFKLLKQESNEKLARADDERRTAQHQLNEVTTAKDAAEKNLKTAQDRLSNAEKAKKTAELQAAKAQREKEDALQKAKGNEEEIKKIIAETEKKEKESAENLSKAVAERQEAQRELEAITVSKNNTEKSLKDAQERLADAEKAKKAAEGLAAEVQKNSEEAVRKAERKQSEAAQALVAVEKREKESAALLARAEEERQQAQRQLDDVTTAKDAAEKELKSAQDRLADVEKARKSAEDQVAESEENQKKAEKAKKEAEKALAVSETALRASAARLADMEKTQQELASKEQEALVAKRAAEKAQQNAEKAKGEAEEKAATARKAQQVAEGMLKKEQDKALKNSAKMLEMEDENRKLREQLAQMKRDKEHVQKELEMEEDTRKKLEEARKKEEEERRQRTVQAAQNAKDELESASVSFNQDEWSNALLHWANAVDLGWKMPVDMASDVDAALDNCVQQYKRDIAAIDETKTGATMRRRTLNEWIDTNRGYHRKIKKSAGT